MPIYKIKGVKKDGLQKYHVRINYIADNGQSKQLTRTAYGGDNAKRLEMQLIEQIKIKGEKPVRKMTVQELFNEYIEVKKYEVRKMTLLRIQQNYKYYISHVFHNFYIDKITVRDIQNWKITMEKRNLALNTKKKAFAHFSAMINYAIRMEYLHKNPLRIIGTFRNALEIKNKMNIYTLEEFRMFITVAKKIAEEKENLQKDLSEWNYYVFFNIAFYTGLRKGEIHALKWSDIDGSYILVNRTMTQRLKEEGETAPKSKSSIRRVQMPFPLIQILEEQRQRQQILHNFTDDFRICNSISDTTIQRRNEIYSKKAKLKTIRVHDFRHTHASVLANQNINIQEVSRRLGHNRIEMTWNTYCHLYPKEEEKAIAILNNIT